MGNRVLGGCRTIKRSLPDRHTPSARRHAKHETTDPARRMPRPRTTGALNPAFRADLTAAGSGRQLRSAKRPKDLSTRLAYQAGFRTHQREQYRRPVNQINSTRSEGKLPN